MLTVHKSPIKRQRRWMDRFQEMMFLVVDNGSFFLCIRTPKQKYYSSAFVTYKFDHRTCKCLPSLKITIKLGVGGHLQSSKIRKKILKSLFTKKSAKKCNFMETTPHCLPQRLKSTLEQP